MKSGVFVRNEEGTIISRLNRSIRTIPIALILAGAALLAFTPSVIAQDKGNENTADRTLKGTGRVNPSTLAMEFQITLGSYPGRGINVPISLSYSSKLWRLQSDGIHPVPGGNSSNCRQHYFVKFSEDSASGWTTSLAAPYVEYTGMQTYFNNDGSAVAYGEVTCPSSQTTWEDTTYTLKYIRRLLVHLPSGETHEMRADDTPVSFTWNAMNTDRPDIETNWDAVYYAADGSNIVYVQDSTTDTYRLLMPDGSYYDFDDGATHGADRKAEKFTSRNPDNYTTYYGPGSTDDDEVTHENGYWKDTIGRNLSIPFAPEAPDEPTSESTPQEYEIPGLDGENNIVYKLHWKKLKGTSAAESALTNFSTSLRQVGDVYYCENPNPSQCVYASSSSEILFSGGGEAASSPRLFSEWGENDFNPILLTKIELPNGQSYKFTYDIYGRIEKIVYPTGGEEILTYDVVDTLTKLEPDDVSGITNFGVVDRKLYKTPAGSYYNWTYSTNYESPSGYKVTIVNPDETKVERYLHRGNDPGHDFGTFGYDNGLAGMQYKTASFDKYGNPVSQTVTHWDKTTFTVTSSIGADWHPRVTHEENYVYDPADEEDFVWATNKYEYEDLSDRSDPLLRKKMLQYDFQSSSGSSGYAPIPDPSSTPNPNPTPVPTPTPGTLVRSVETTFLIYDTSLASTFIDDYYDIANLKNIVGLVTASVIKDASGTIVSKSETVYDESGSSNAGRGNPTTSRVWDSTQGVVTNSSAYIETSATFDQWGNQTTATDANGNTTTTTWDSTHHAFPIEVESPIPDNSAPYNGSNAAFETEATFDISTGLPLTTTDANSTVTKMTYDPETLRPTLIQKAYGTDIEHQTQFVYDDVNNWVKTRSQIDENNWAESIAHYDGLGRTNLSEQVHSSGNVFVEKEFDADGRVHRVSNPYRCNPSWTPECETVVWAATNTYDDAGRLVTVTLPDNSTVTTTYSVSLTGKIGTSKQVTDQAGKKREGISDALGRMIRVIEDPAGTPLTTDYTFDVLGNLRKTEQGSQYRYFNHDSLGRLLYSKQPEEEANSAYSGGNCSGICDDAVTLNDQWATKFEYDDNGNMTKITNAEDVHVIATYDALNRIVKRDYEDATPDVDFYYDGTGLASAPDFSLGQTTKVTSSVSETQYTEFDEMGRLLAHKQITQGETYSTAYVYNLSGALVEETYPSTRKVQHTVNENGELSQVKSRKNSNYGFYTYASGFHYNSSGMIDKLKLGNGRWETASYNSRLQITGIGLGITDSDQDLLSLSYQYETVSQTDNNGSLRKQTVDFDGLADPIEQNYTYDDLNRLKSAIETVDSTEIWNQTFNYDRFGNRTFDATYTDTFAQSNKVTNPTIDSTTNRITEDQDGGGNDYEYDRNGNLTFNAGDSLESCGKVMKRK